MLEDAALAIAALLFSGAATYPIAKLKDDIKRKRHDCLADNGKHLYLVVPVQNIFKCSIDGSEFVYDQGEYRRLNGARR